MEELQLHNGCSSVLLMHQLLICWQRYRAPVEDARRTAKVHGSTVTANVTTALAQAEQAANELQVILDQLPGTKHRARLNTIQAEKAAQAQTLLASLFGTIGELQHYREVGFPRDSWESGRKPAVDMNVHRIGKRR